PASSHQQREALHAGSSRPAKNISSGQNQYPPAQNRGGMAADFVSQSLGAIKRKSYRSCK
ncbi:MAG TPA: hypothetical protein DCY53_06510, partial [Desulfobacteraceae bacterium]|nr:hypothetical protein [Desulfobacteraceae bacterium]